MEIFLLIYVCLVEFVRCKILTKLELDQDFIEEDEIKVKKFRQFNNVRRAKLAEQIYWRLWRYQEQISLIVFIYKCQANNFNCFNYTIWQIFKRLFKSYLEFSESLLLFLGS